MPPALRWSDIDWAQGRFTIRSPKTEHHAGHGSRQVPLFPELAPYLREVFEQAEPGRKYVITRYSDSNQNLRSTRETELAENFSLHVVCAWIGNSRLVAMKHYLQVTDGHFAKAVQNPVQQVSASARKDSQAGHAEEPEPAICGTLRQDAVQCTHREVEMVGARGLEPLTSSL
ncbi:unnamed protein product [marine sediment metagenome]|uniref:Tyr recombinase domain-containing protein n=1 Tax=marine sediment metagenome TaxID=412755 RepID=X1H0L7_9ZZZZ